MDLINLKETDKAWLESVVDLGLAIKKDPGRYSDALKGRTLAMIFQKTSTRTRLSFETGMTKLGGHAIFVDWRTTQLSLGGVPDEAKVISRYADAIMVRLLKNETVLAMAEGSEKPLINGLCQLYHPCQAITDIMTIKERKGRLEGVKAVYLGIANNVSNSLAMACAKTGVDFTLCVPEKDPDASDPEHLSMLKGMPNYREEADISKAVPGADMLYTDTWVNMEFYSDPKFAQEKARREKVFMPYQLNRRMMDLAGPQCFSMHDMPAHIGYEIDEYGLRGERSLAFDQAENRMWAQMALLIKLIGDGEGS